MMQASVWYSVAAAFFLVRVPPVTQNMRAIPSCLYQLFECSEGVVNALSTLTLLQKHYEVYDLANLRPHREPLSAEIASKKLELLVSGSSCMCSFDP